MSSMSTYDAAFMGVPTLLLCPTLRADGVNATMFSDLKEVGYAELGEIAVDSIDTWVNKVNKKLPLKSINTKEFVNFREIIFS